MSSHLINVLGRRIAKATYARLTAKSPRSEVPFVHRCGFERLEDRRMLSVGLVPLEDTSISGSTGEKPQSKVWSHDGTWFGVFARSDGTWLSRLDGSAWTPELKLSSGRYKADVKAVDNVTHILLEKDDHSKLASVEYVPGTPGTYQFWSERPSLVNVPLHGSAETATIDVDSTGRLWIASDTTTKIEVRYSQAPYATWSDPITVASGVDTDDISVITALPNGSIGVLWSDQESRRFGFRVHNDAAAPNSWSADEVPASQSAQNAGSGMADDHLNVAVASDGTLYAAVKTGYDTSGMTEIGLLVRRPSGQWDPMYNVDTKGTRPIVVLNEAADRLFVAYRNTDSSGPIVYRESALSSIAFGARETLISGSSPNNVSSTKQSFTGDVVLIAAGGGTLAGVLLDVAQGENRAPTVYAGADQTVFDSAVVTLDGTVTDDGLPGAPNLLTTTWTMVGGPGTVDFADPFAVDTTATFSGLGQYVLRLTANDGELVAMDEVTVTVEETPSFVTQSFQNGVDGYLGTIDTRIRGDMPTRVFGNSSKLEIDGKPDFSTLLRWDLGWVPAGATILSATISVHTVATSNDLFELYALKRPWVESEANFLEASSGDLWEVSGASGAGDRGTTVLGTLTAPTLGQTTVELNDAGRAVLQSWLANPQNNHGFIFQDYTDATTDDLDFRSSETSKVAERPKLTIAYTLGDLVNQAPLVNAGVDRTIFDSEIVAMGGTVTDDGLPSPANVSTVWTAESVPTGETVTFGDSLAVDTTATFSGLGQYVLRLTANDGELVAMDEVTVTVEETPSFVTQSFQNGVDGYLGTIDTRIRGDMPTRVFGNSSKLEIDGKPDFSTLLRWDLGSVPAGATILSATISVHTVATSNDLFELYALKRSWVESEANFLEASSGNLWEVSGASGGGDRGTTVLGTLTAPTLGQTTLELNDAGLAVLQSWLADPQSNHGFIFQDYTDATTDDLDFRSSETSNVEERPKLTIAFTPELVDAVMMLEE